MKRLALSVIKWLNGRNLTKQSWLALHLAPHRPAFLH